MAASLAGLRRPASAPRAAHAASPISGPALCYLCRLWFQPLPAGSSSSRAAHPWLQILPTSRAPQRERRAEPSSSARRLRRVPARSGRVRARLFPAVQVYRHLSIFGGPPSIATQVLAVAGGWRGFGVVFAIGISLLAALMGLERFASAPGSRIAGLSVAWYWTFLSLVWLVLLLSWRSLQTG